MTDTLIIQSLRVNTQIGIHTWEQKIKQPLLLDISIPSDFRSCQDNISSTLDYDDLCQKVTALVESQSFQLIETVANQVAEFIKIEFKVAEVYVAVTKPLAVKNAGAIKVAVNR